MKIDTYVINLKTSPERKAYMEKELAPYPFLDVHFIEGVDGRSMTCSDQEKLFDQNRAFRRYGRILGCGEVGCTLSHIECCRRMLDSSSPFGMIVEDDLVMRNGTKLESVLHSSTDFLSKSGPRIILLTGDYWFTYKKKFSDGFEIAKVYDAVCAGAYLLNREAAAVILNMGKSHIADDWITIKKQGISVYALYPHVADQNRLYFQTTIANSLTGRTYRAYMSRKNRFTSYKASIIKRFLKSIKHFEFKDFVW
jgi:glycosyl transferase family 25